MVIECSTNQECDKGEICEDGECEPDPGYEEEPTGKFALKMIIYYRKILM
jgi:hypothetical protein